MQKQLHPLEKYLGGHLNDLRICTHKSDSTLEDL